MAEGAAERRLTPEDLHRLLRYDPETGLLYWRARNASDFVAGRGAYTAARICQTWNAKYAGKEAFSIDVSTGYRSGSVCGVKVLAHRAIWAMQTGEWPSGEVDHENGDRSYNRWGNLRSVPKAENAKNQRLRATNASGMMGVIWTPRLSKWRSRIMVGGKTHNLGCFSTFEEACAARKQAEALFGFHPNHGRAV